MATRTAPRIRFNRLDTAPTPLARRLYAKRADDGLSLVQAAKQARIPRATFHRLETSEMRPTLGTLFKVSRWLSCEVWELVP